MSERPDSSKYKGDGSLSDFHCDTDDYIDKIENELAEARAAIERLKTVSEYRRAVMLEVADSLDNNKLTDEDDYEDGLIEDLRSGSEEEAALSAAERGEG